MNKEGNKEEFNSWDDLLADQDASLLNQATASYAQVSEVDTKAAWSKFYADKRVSSLNKWSLSTAAAVALVMAFFFIFDPFGSNPEHVSTEAESQSIELPDASIVSLDRYSSLAYEKDFEDKRYASLEGRAFFEVVKSDVPFRVKANDVMIEVLGTAFSVEAPKSGDVRVYVKEGSVEINYSGQPRAVLKAGQELIYYKGRQWKIEESTDNAMAWKTGELIFEAEPLKEITEDISRFYNVDIDLEDSTLADCVLTLSLPVKSASVDETLDFIAAPMAMKLNKLSDEQFTLSGGRCN